MARRPAPLRLVRTGDVAGPGHALGLDVGGTKIAGGLVDLASGAILARRQVPTGAERGGPPVLADLTAMAAELAAEARARGLALGGAGVGVAELVAPSGRVFSDYRIKWRDLDVAGAVGAALGGLPVRLNADVRAAARAEARFGAGRGCEDFYYVTIGTGVSGVLVRRGQPYAGSRGAALVIANGRSLARCRHCGEITARVVEDIASGPGLVAAWGGAGSAEHVLAAAGRGDAAALAAIEDAALALGGVLALLVNALDPARLILGGGLGSAPGAYFDRLAATIRAGLWEGDQRPLPILRAALGPDAGLIGAALDAPNAPDAPAAPDAGPTDGLPETTEPERETTHGIS